MLLRILVGLVVIVLVLVVLIAMRPQDFRVTRTTTINARAAVVFEQVNDLHKWEAWSPWAKLDPAAKNTYEGPPSGAGAAFGWSGNNKIGEGRMQITESRPNEYVRFQLDFLRPFKASNIAEFTFKPEGNQTAVSWSMSGKNNFLSKAMGLFLDCDKMVGGEFEKGLAQMKSICEATAQK